MLTANINEFSIIAFLMQMYTLFVLKMMVFGGQSQPEGWVPPGAMIQHKYFHLFLQICDIFLLLAFSNLQLIHFYNRFIA